MPDPVPPPTPPAPDATAALALTADAAVDATPASPAGGRYVFVPDMADRYIKALTDRPKLKRRLKVVAACGNGTAGAFAPQVLAAVGCEVIPLNADLDFSFPNHNPNPAAARPPLIVFFDFFADKRMGTG